jgi:hypothetical protein
MNQQQRAVVQQALEAAYLAGFQATGEGYNAEYPFEGCNPEADAAWVKDRDSAIRQLLEQPATWVGLTQREWDDLWDEHHDDYGYQLSADGYERAIEAKLKEKNT